MYELNFEDHLIPVLDGVHEVPNLLTLGRHGLFLNNSMDDNVLLGMKVAGPASRLPQVRIIRRGKTDMLAFMNLRFQGSDPRRPSFLEPGSESGPGCRVLRAVLRAELRLCAPAEESDGASARTIGLTGND